jgi:membrane protein DedA with SNARE-associated domain
MDMYTWSHLALGLIVGAVFGGYVLYSVGYRQGARDQRHKQYRAGV